MLTLLLLLVQVVLDLLAQLLAALLPFGRVRVQLVEVLDHFVHLVVLGDRVA